MFNPKKLFAIAIMLVLSLALTAHEPKAAADETITTPDKVVVFKIGDYNYYIVDLKQNKSETVKMDTAPQVYPPGRTFVPVRFLGNALGVTDENISWENSKQTATLKGKKTLQLQIGNSLMQSGGDTVKMDVVPLVQPPGRTMLPARYVAEGLGYIVEWDAQNQLVIAYPEGQPKPDIEKIRKLIGDISPGVKIVSEKDLTPEAIQTIRNIKQLNPDEKWASIEPKYHEEYKKAIQRDFLNVMVVRPDIEPITKIDSIVVSDKLFYQEDRGGRTYRVIINGNQIWDVIVIFTGKQREAVSAVYLGTI